MPLCAGGFRLRTHGLLFRRRQLRWRGALVLLLTLPALLLFLSFPVTLPVRGD